LLTSSGFENCLNARLIAIRFSSDDPMDGHLFSFTFWFYRLSWDAGLEDYTAEAQGRRGKNFSLGKYSELCELCVSVVNNSS